MVGLKQMTGAMKQIQSIAEGSAKKTQWGPKKIPNHKKQLMLYRANNPDDAETLPDRIRQQFHGEIQVGSVSGETAGKVLLRFALQRPGEKLPAGQLAPVRIPSQKHAANLETPQGHNPNIYKKIANFCLLFSLFNCDFNQNIYYRAQITLTLKNFHKQIIYTYKRFKNIFARPNVYFCILFSFFDNA